MFWSHFKFIVLFLLAGNVISTILTYKWADGDNGWWPVYFIIVCVVSLIYAAAFSYVASWKALPIFPAGYIHIALSVISVVLTVMFYQLSIDWLAINNGAEMTWLQKIVHSDFTRYAIYLVFLLIAIAVGVGAKIQNAS